MPNSKKPSVICSVDKNKNAISFFGDLHPDYSGNVVRAMSSAKQGYSQITEILEDKKPNSNETTEEFFNKISEGLTARVHAVNRLTPTIVEVVVKAPFAAKNFKPGQFYRLQNYEANALQVLEKSPDYELKTSLSMEGIALTGSGVDREKGLVYMIVLEMGGSSSLCSYLKEGEEVVLMGPTGTATEIVPNETVLFLGGGLGNAVLFSIGEEMRKQGCRVLYFAGYRDVQDRYKVEEIERAADVIVWCCDTGKFEVDRPQDMSFQGNIVEAMLDYAGKDNEIPFSEIDRIITIGSDKMMAAVKNVTNTKLKKHFKKDVISIGSINSPMQCMMKEICAQCLQKHTNANGEEVFVYSCANQDQNMDTVSFSHLDQRLKQNSVQEKLTAMWIKRCLEQI